MNFKTNSHGLHTLNFELSEIERKILRSCCDFLEDKGLKYISIPSTITAKTFISQEIKTNTFSYGYDDILGGSAEQGILQYFSNSKVQPMRIFSENTCFRVEDQYEGLKRVKEFKKVEQFSFSHKQNALTEFDFLLNNAIEFLESINIKNYRLVNVTNLDPGYHKKKIDIEVWTEEYGWLETHSCSYFGEEQTKRYNIVGATHTVSNTGIASPRILIPIIEKINMKKKGMSI